jgi:ATP-dependent Clp protease ATP-binding subunit ClpC
MLLQIMEEGRLTDSFGRHVDFKNVILIMTSNIGAHRITHQDEMRFWSSVSSRTWTWSRSSIWSWAS